jgi:type III secretion system chaperone SycN
MNRVSEVIQEFGRGMGIGNLRRNASGVVCLEFETQEALYLEEREDTLLVYLAIPVPYPTTVNLVSALKLCHYSWGSPRPIQVGLAGTDKLVFAARLPSSMVNLPELQAAVEQLIDLELAWKGGS